MMRSFLSLHGDVKQNGIFAGSTQLRHSTIRMTASYYTDPRQRCCRLAIFFQKSAKGTLHKGWRSEMRVADRTHGPARRTRWQISEQISLFSVWRLSE